MSGLAPCPFCGGAARIESNRDWHKLFASHDDDCVFDADDHDLMYPAQPGYLIEIAQVWNRRAPLPTEQPSNPVPRMGGNTKCLTDKQMATIERAARVSENSGHPRLADSLRGILARIVGQQTKGGGNAD